MPETELATALAQLGAAGLIGWMWLTERRAAAARERQLTEAHDRITHDRLQLDALLAALDRNTRALAAVEHGQRRLTDVLHRFPTTTTGTTTPGHDHPPVSPPVPPTPTAHPRSIPAPPTATAA